MAGNERTDEETFERDRPHASVIADRVGGMTAAMGIDLQRSRNAVSGSRNARMHDVNKSELVSFIDGT